MNCVTNSHLNLSVHERTLSPLQPQRHQSKLKLNSNLCMVTSGAPITPSAPLALTAPDAPGVDVAGLPRLID